MFDEHKASWKEGKHQTQWWTTLEQYAFPTLGKLVVSDIEGPMIRNVLAIIWLSKPETARRCGNGSQLSLIGHMPRGIAQAKHPCDRWLGGSPNSPGRPAFCGHALLRSTDVCRRLGSMLGGNACYRGLTDAIDEIPR